MYYKVYVEYLQKSITKAFTWSIQGNFIGGKMTGVIKLNNNDPI